MRIPEVKIAKCFKQCLAQGRCLIIIQTHGPVWGVTWFLLGLNFARENRGARGPHYTPSDSGLLPFGSLPTQKPLSR